MRTLMGVILMLCCRLALATTEPAPTTQAAKIKERAELEVRAGQLPTIGPFKLEDVVQLHFEGQRLLAKTTIPASSDERRVMLEKDPSFATITMASAPVRPDPKRKVTDSGPDSFQFLRYDFSDPSNVFFHAAVYGGPGMRVQIVGEWEMTPDENRRRQVALLDQEPEITPEGEASDSPLHLYVDETNDEGEPTIHLNLVSADLRTLQRTNPSEVNAYLRPVLRAIKKESILTIDPQVAWQVFAPDKHPDPTAAAKVSALLPKLDAASFADREAASDALKALGKNGAIALMHVDRSKLSPEQNTRIDDVLSNYHQAESKEASELASKTDFLLDCLASDDVEIRKIALEHLAKKTAKLISFEPSAAADVRQLQLDALRAKLLPLPATQSSRPTSEPTRLWLRAGR